MNPPPPMLPAPGYVTASANAVATAASTAFPPRRRMLAPTSDAIDELEMTSPRFETTIPAESVCAERIVDENALGTTAAMTTACLRRESLMAAPRCWRTGESLDGLRARR